MKLRGIDFGNVWVASGVQGFFGEGYWFHWFWWIFGLRFGGSTFTAKTTTLPPRAGNMLLTKRFTPLHLLPRCIWISIWSFIRCYMLNAVGLSGPGLAALLATGKWQTRTDPFFISYMPISGTLEERLEETRRFVAILKNPTLKFLKWLGIQFNISCPNTGHDLDDLIAEAKMHLAILGELRVPIVVKINLLVTPKAAYELSQDPNCDAICVGNATPFGELVESIDWKALFPPHGLSPLELRSKQFGKGGFSGEITFEILKRWVREAAELKFEKPINACNGIVHRRHVGELIEAGLRPGIDSISFAGVAVYRPWRVAGIIREGNRLLKAS